MNSGIAHTIGFRLLLGYLLTGYPSAATASPEGDAPIRPAAYQQMLGKGIDVNWMTFYARHPERPPYYDKSQLLRLKELGVKHVRIRIADDERNLALLDSMVRDCLENDVVPVIAYTAKAFKENPTQAEADRATAWWRTTADYFRNTSHRLAFNLIIEPLGTINHHTDALNAFYDDAVTAIRETNPTRIILIAPNHISSPDHLCDLRIPARHNGYLMGEWHFYASGPSKTNPNKRWTTGTPEEKQLITDRIATAVAWQRQTGIPTWVGAWMPGNYNKGDDYTPAEQLIFARFMNEALTTAGIPYAVNADTQFYDREKGLWLEDKLPVLREALK